MAKIPQKRDEAANRDSRGRFGPGNRANPGGRPSVGKELRLLLEPHRDRLAERLLELVESENESIALGAIKECHDRIYGKPSQEIRHSGSMALVADAEMERALDDALSRLGR